MAIAITAKNTEIIIIPCYKVLSMDIGFLGSQNCPKSSKAFKTLSDVFKSQHVDVLLPGWPQE